MADARLCVFLLVIFVKYQIIVSKPLLGLLWCDLLCDDDDDVSTVTSTTPDYDDVCSACPTRAPPNAGQRPPTFNLRLPPTNGMNLSMTNTNGQWSFNLDALSNGMPAVTTPPDVTTIQPNAIPAFGILSGAANQSVIPIIPLGSMPGFNTGKK